MLKIISLSLIYGIIIGLSLILMFVQYRVKRLRHNPGQILFTILLSQTIMSMFMVFSQFYVVGESNESSYTIILSDFNCILIAVPSLIVSMLYAISNILLIANIYCQIYVKNYKNYNLKKEVILGMTLIIFIIILLVYISQDLGVSILGECNLESQNVFTMFLIYLRSILLIILSLTLIKLQGYSPEILQSEIYKTVIDKFIRKYLPTYIKVNVSYGWLFLISRLLIPIILNYYQHEQQLIIILQYVQATMTLIMVIIRFHEPIIHRHVRYLFRPKKCVLQKRLLNQEKNIIRDTNFKWDENIILQTEEQHIMEIKFYQQQKNSLLLLSIEQLDSRLSLPQDLIKNQQQYTQNIIQYKGQNELIIFLQATYQIFEDCQYYQNYDNTYYQFNKIQQHYIKIDQNDNQILITTYGQDILCHKLKEYFGVNLIQIKNSLNVSINSEYLKSYSLSKGGTLFITHDNLISCEFITRDQKRQLTKGGGLQQLWQRLHQEYLCTLGIFLPVIFAVHSYCLDDNYFTLVFKLNRLQLQYPLLEEMWSQKQILNSLIRYNIIGWITIDNGIYNQRFLAQEVNDGKYNIIFSKNDYLLDEIDKQSLIDMIRRDYITMQQMKCSFTLQFVYTKYTSARLQSLAGKEKQFEQDQSIVNKKKKNIMNLIGNIASFELKTKLGFVQVFWDDCWKYYESDIEKIIYIINNKF